MESNQIQPVLHTNTTLMHILMAQIYICITIIVSVGFCFPKKKKLFRTCSKPCGCVRAPHFGNLDIPRSGTGAWYILKFISEKFSLDLYRTEHATYKVHARTHELKKSALCPGFFPNLVGWGNSQISLFIHPNKFLCLRVISHISSSFSLQKGT